MLQLKNNTPFAATFTFFPNENGVDTLYIMVKATFLIGEKWVLASSQIPLQQGDEYWGEPAKSSLRFSSDYHTGKSGTDILMTGSACTPDQRPLRQMDVGIQVGLVSKVVRVFGDRFWNNDQITQPEPFVTMPLVYERAFGGQDLINGETLREAETRNPVGRGFTGQKHTTELNGFPLPNLECPDNLIRDYRDRPAPACFAPVAPNWQPRAGFAGTYDDNWQQTRAPYLPDDYNPRFMNVAPPDLIYPGYLQGGEAVRIIGMHPAGDLGFTLPYVNLSNKVLVAGQEMTSPFNIETLMLDPNHRQLSMVWRAALACDKKLTKIQQITVSLSR
jgi:hypothetical protein